MTLSAEATAAHVHTLRHAGYHEAAQYLFELHAKIVELEAHLRPIPAIERVPEFDTSFATRNDVPALVLTDRGFTAFMVYSRNPYAKTAKGQAPRWKYLGRDTLWNIQAWQPLPKLEHFAKYTFLEPLPPTTSGGDAWLPCASSH